MHAQLSFSGRGYDRKTVHYRYFVLKRGIRLARPSSLVIYQVIFQSYSDYLKYSPHKPAIEVTVAAAVNGTVKYRSDSWLPSLSIGNGA